MTASADRHDALAFFPGVAERLGWYVYALRDPRTGMVFYVGKGKGDRVHQHARQARKVAGETAGELKLNTIREIHEAGQQVGVEIVRHQIENEQVAYEIEAAVIDALRLTGSSLSNEARGHGSSRGYRPLEEIVAHYAARRIEITDPVLLIRITRLYKPGMNDDELYRATREWWRISPRRHPDARWALSVYDGIVRAAYRIDSWEQEPSGGGQRWRFGGVRDPVVEQRYLWANVSELLPNGAQNPVRYINC